MIRTMASQETLSRISRLRNRLINCKREICTERAKYLTESFKKTEALPIAIRRALALDCVLEHLTLDIAEEELIVGRVTGKPRGNALCPELRNTGHRLIPEDDERMTKGANITLPVPRDIYDTVADIDRYWAGKTVYEKWDALAPQAGKALSMVMEWGNQCTEVGQYTGHESYDPEIAIEKGLLGRIKDVEAEIDKLEITDPKYYDRLSNLQASQIALNAGVKFAGRYSEYAARLGEKETDAKRRAEFFEISRICGKVPANPPETFREAVQCVWLTYCILSNESFGNSTGFSRPDRYLYPFYRAEKDAGTLTDEEAMMIIAMLFIKCNETVDGNLNHSMDVNIVVGGVDRNGEDAVNELSYILLDAEELVALSSEDVIIRVSRKNPEDFVARAVEVAIASSGKLKFMGDETLIRQMLIDGRPLELARNVCIMGCTSPTIPGYSHDLPGGTINLPLLLDLALHDGYSVMDQYQMGPHTGDARKFTSYNELWQAYKAQCAYFIPYMRMMNTLDKKIFAENTPNPFQSALMHGCIEKGIDVLSGGTYPQLSFALSLAGAPNVGDSLAAVNKLVFEDGFISMSGLIDALDRNFEGADELVYRISKIPRYGNNDDYADQFVCSVLDLAADIGGRSPGYAGALPTVAASAVSANIDLGFHVGALPDGRPAGVPISEGGISPYQGSNVSGVTSTLLSAAKIDNLKLRHGSVLNMRFDPEAVRTHDHVLKLTRMIRTYLEEDAFLIQFNFVTAETLRAAKTNPEKYRDLIVRVATFSAFFTELQPDLQDDIIRRTEFSELS